MLLELLLVHHAARTSQSEELPPPPTHTHTHSVYARLQSPKGSYALLLDCWLFQCRLLLTCSECIFANTHPPVKTAMAVTSASRAVRLSLSSGDMSGSTSPHVNRWRVAGPTHWRTRGSRSPPGRGGDVCMRGEGGGGEGGRGGVQVNVGILEKEGERL